MANEIQAVDTQDIRPGFFSAAAIKQLKVLTTIFSKSSLVPQAYRNNESDCAIVLNLASRMNADPLMMLQNVYVVHGTPALSSKMLIALFNSCGRFGSIHYHETGKKGTDTQGIIAWAKELATGDILEGPEVTIAVAKAEGWYSKNGSKWQTMPEQMLRYRAASWFIRTTAPELSVGLQTDDEVIDVTPRNDTEEVQQNANREEFIPEAPAPAITPGHKVTLDDLNKAENDTKEPAPVKTAAPKEEKAKATAKEEKPQQEALIEGPGF